MHEWRKREEQCADHSAVRTLLKPAVVDIEVIAIVDVESAHPVPRMPRAIRVSVRRQVLQRSQPRRHWTHVAVRALLRPALDVRKAHLNPACDVDEYVELPPEAGAAPGMCGKLLRWLYGMRGAAQAWGSHYSAKLEEIGFEQGMSSPAVFYHREKCKGASLED